MLSLNTTSTSGLVTNALTPVGGASSAAAAGASSGAGASAAPAAVQIVNIDTSVLSVVIQPAAGAPKPLVDITAIVDKTPPVISLKGTPFVQVLQATPYTDAGATAFDNIDGNNVQVRSRLAVCRRPAGAEKWAADGPATQLACNSSVYATVNTSDPSGDWVWVFTYAAKDAAGNAAVSLRRLVEVAPRWAVGAMLLQQATDCGGWLRKVPALLASRGIPFQLIICTRTCSQVRRA